MTADFVITITCSATPALLRGRWHSERMPISALCAGNMSLYSWFLPVRCYACAVLAMAWCLSVCVRHNSMFFWNSWMNRAGFWHWTFEDLIYPTLCFKEIRVPPKIRYFPLELCPKLWTWKIRYDGAIVEMCYKLCSSKVIKVDAQSVINWTIGQLSW